MQTVINVANRLPITVGETIQKSSGGLVSALEGVSKDRYHLQWIGWPGLALDDPAERSKLEKELVERYAYRPIFLSEDEVERYYDGFSNSSLWPILHYNRTYMHYSEKDWEAYQTVNRRFADYVLEAVTGGEMVWVHDYHLMLLPQMLREARSDLRVGYFLHTPFPSSEFFRCHPRRAELLQGLLGADLIGFHTFGYLRHFRSTVLRILGIESEISVIRRGNHRSALGVYPIGIDAQRFIDELATERVAKRRAELQENWKGKRLILSVERLDYSKGLLRRLEAIDYFLSQLDNTDHYVFLFIAVPSRVDVTEYQNLGEQIQTAVGRINGRYATVNNSPIHYINHSVPFTELCALYSFADVALVTPLVDGMNLVAKEYVACQGENPGVLVLSEFAGVAQEFVNAISVNPFDYQQVSDAIHTALDMDLEERQRRMNYLRHRALKYDANYWATSFLTQLESQVQFMSSPAELKESRDAIITRLNAAKRAALFLDYDGTLREFTKQPTKAFPNENVTALLTALDDHECNVFLISGRSADTLERWFGAYQFTLVAEHGNSYRLAGTSDWRSLGPESTFSWKDRVLELFRYYEGSTPGSHVEEKKSAIVWHYRQCDPEYGQWKANQLMSEAAEMLANFPVEVHHGKKIVEVASIHVNKGAAVMELADPEKYDLILCAGDDQTDESMFRLHLKNMIGVKVGEGDTEADYRVPDPEHFRNLLQGWLRASRS